MAKAKEKEKEKEKDGEKKNNKLQKVWESFIVTADGQSRWNWNVSGSNTLPHGPSGDFALDYLRVSGSVK
jgi:hypothetical protein